MLPSSPDKRKLRDPGTGAAEGSREEPWASFDNRADSVYPDALSNYRPAVR